MSDASFATGSLRVVSHARPGKLFTASRDLMVTQVGILSGDALREIVERVVEIFRSGLSA